MYIFYGCMADERQFLIFSERIEVSTNSRKTKTTTYRTCRCQIVKMVSRSLFLFPVYKRHFYFFPVIIIYLRRAYILWIRRPQKYRNSRWNFTNILFQSEPISISGLQAPFCFLTVIIICLCRTYVRWIWRPQKCRYSRWNFSNMLFLTKGLLFPVLGAILDFCMSVHYNTAA